MNSITDFENRLRLVEQIDEQIRAEDRCRSNELNACFDEYTQYIRFARNRLDISCDQLRPIVEINGDIMKFQFYCSDGKPDVRWLGKELKDFVNFSQKEWNAIIVEVRRLVATVNAGLISLCDEKLAGRQKDAQDRMNRLK